MVLEFGPGAGMASDPGLRYKESCTACFLASRFAVQKSAACGRQYTRGNLQREVVLVVRRVAARTGWPGEGRGGQRRAVAEPEQRQ